MVTSTRRRKSHWFAVVALLTILPQGVHAHFPRSCRNEAHVLHSNTTRFVDRAAQDEPCKVDTLSQSQRQGNDESKQCSIFMAPSSLIGSTGFGIYTTRDIERGSDLLTAPDGPSIPIVDFSVGPPSKARKQWIAAFDDYWWGDSSNHVSLMAEEVLDFQITFGSLINHHCILQSVDVRYPETVYDDSLVDRLDDPGAGAFSYSMGREFYASRDLEAGSELFLNYGHCIRDEETLRGWPWTAHIPMAQDYKTASSICWKYLHPRFDDAGHDEEIVAPEGINEFVAKLLPQTISQLRSIANAADERLRSPRDLVYHLAKHMTTTPRNTDWIKRNGMCLDNLVPSKSGLPHAGQGAFAQYGLRKGEIVVPMPMLHLIDKDVLLMHDRSDDGIFGTPQRRQLLLNYCFGHKESSLLLCPETNAILINHCSLRKQQCGPHGPNAEYRWSSGWEPKSDEYRNMTIDEIAKQPGRGLSMEIVAVRDIQPGEEVFIDYGPEWEDAWEAHVAIWTSSAANASDPIRSVKKANEHHGPLLDLVSGDIRTSSNHSYMFTGCKYQASRLDEKAIWYEDHGDWHALSDEELVLRFADDGGVYDRKDDDDDEYWPCTVIAPEDESGSYVVRIYQSSMYPQQVWHEKNLPRILRDYPRESIRYFVKPYANDQYMPRAFRHYIPIRDDMLPVQWKNRVYGSS